MSSLCEGEEHSSRPATQCCLILQDANIVKKNINCSYSCSIQSETGLFWIKVMKVDLINRDTMYFWPTLSEQEKMTMKGRIYNRSKNLIRHYKFHI